MLSDISSPSRTFVKCTPADPCLVLSALISTYEETRCISTLFMPEMKLLNLWARIVDEM